MCGIAGYSFRARSGVERTLAAQALLAGDRRARRRRRRLCLPGAGGHLSDGGQAAHAGLASCSSGSPFPHGANQLLVHVRDYTKGHPSIAANNHPVRHGPVVGIHNGIIVNDDELLAQHDCSRAEPRMTVDSEAIFAVAAHSRNDARALEHLRGAMATAWLDEREPGNVFLARGVRPSALARRRPRRASSSPPHGRRSRSSSATAASSCASTRCARARRSSSRDGAVVRRERFRPDHDYVEADPLPAVRAPEERDFCLSALAALASPA